MVTRGGGWEVGNWMKVVEVETPYKINKYWERKFWYKQLNRDPDETLDVDVFYVVQILTEE